MLGSETASERAIEDILVQSPQILASILDTSFNELVPVARQYTVPSGRTDLIYLAGPEVVLIELKAETAIDDHVEQLSGYVSNFEDPSTRPAFVQDRQVRPVLLAPEIPPDIRTQCTDRGLEPIEYEITHVLGEYQEMLFSDLAQFQVTGHVTSVANLGLMNRFLRFLSESDKPVQASDAAEAYDRIGKGDAKNPESRIRDFLQTALALDLVLEAEDGASLTSRGQSFVSSGDYETRPWTVTAEQANEVVELLYEDPFYSNLTYSLVALLDSTFELAKNVHPVPRKEIEDWYAAKVGKRYDWNSRTRRDVVRWLGRFLDELGLLSVVGQKFHVTPGGITLLSHVKIDEGKTMIRSLGGSGGFGSERK